jgi:uncharacterized membrane protein YfcA
MTLAAVVIGTTLLGWAYATDGRRGRLRQLYVGYIAAVIGIVGGSFVRAWAESAPDAVLQSLAVVLIAASALGLATAGTGVQRGDGRPTTARDDKGEGT